MPDGLNLSGFTVYLHVLREALIMLSIILENLREYELFQLVWKHITKNKAVKNMHVCMCACVRESLYVHVLQEFVFVCIQTGMHTSSLKTNILVFILFAHSLGLNDTQHKSCSYSMNPQGQYWEDYDACFAQFSNLIHFSLYLELSLP